MDEESTFPASKNLPSQQVSRSAYAAFSFGGRDYKWWDAYTEIKEKFPHFRNWRIYVFIAWSGQPIDGRDPKNLGDLCQNVLNVSLKSPSNWRAKNYGNLPGVEEAIAYTQAAPLLAHRADVFDALIKVAKITEPSSHSDRKLFLELTGDYDRNPSKNSQADDTGAAEWWDNDPQPETE